MVLEVAAAIVGILAAAGKVAETLGPVVLALRQTTKSVGAVLSEVNNAKIILVALQAFLDDLNAAPRRRRQLIQIDQLITALTDGVLLFSELESLVTRLDNPDFALPKRLQWVWNDKEFTSLISRLQNFKNSIILMLNILQCESDKEAQLHRQELLSNTNHLLKSNAELSRRIAFLEDCFDTSNSIHMRQQASRTSTTAYTKDGAHAMLRESNRRISSIPAEGMPCFQFESALGASRVYRKVQRETADFSFRSSMALSHAWSALSDISLSDISLVSVVALPVLMDDITNTHHYTFHEPEDTVEDNVAPTRIDSALELDTTQDLAPTAKPITRLVKTPSGSLKAELQPSTEFKVIVKGAVEAEMNSLIATFANTHEHSGDTTDLINSYWRTCIIDGILVHVTIEVISDIPGSYAVGLNDAHLKGGDLYMFIYSITSRSSFDYVCECPRRVYEWKETDSLPMMIVGNHCDKDKDRQVLATESRAFANETGCGSCEVSEHDVSSLDLALADLVRSKWAFDKKRREREAREARDARDAEENKKRTMRKEMLFSMKQILRRDKRFDKPSRGPSPSSRKGSVDKPLEMIQEAGWI